MKKIASTLLVGLLAIMFITCVYANGDDAKFSLKVWLTNFASYQTKATLGEDLTAAWTEDHYFYYEKREDGVYHRMIEFYESAYEGNDEILKALSKIPMFFERLWASVRNLFDHCRMLFDWVGVLLPWNSTIKRGDPYV